MALSSDFQGLLARGSVVWGFTPKWGAEKSKGSRSPSLEASPGWLMVRLMVCLGLQGWVL